MIMPHHELHQISCVSQSNDICAHYRLYSGNGVVIQEIAFGQTCLGQKTKNLPPADHVEGARDCTMTQWRASCTRERVAEGA